jgi:competence protein ComEC
VKGRAATAAHALFAHPRHCVLFAVALGLGLGPHAPPPALVVIALAAGAGLLGFAAIAATDAPLAPGAHTAARPVGVALGVAIGVLAGSAVADVRLDALESGRLAAMAGKAVAVAAVVLEPVRDRSAAPSVARVRIRGGALDGETAVMRVPSYRRPGVWPEVGEIVRIEGRVGELGRYDEYQRPRGATAAIEVDELRLTGERRGGLAGALDAVRRRAEAGLERGLRPDEADLVRGMVLGQDDRLADDVREDFKRSGLAHLLAVSGQNVMLLAILVLAVTGAAGMPLRARLLAAMVLIAAYVPLAGGGPSIQRAGVMGAAGLVAALAGRPASRWYAFGLAAAVTLALNPRAASEPGWQLSFAAVLALLLLAGPLRGVLARHMPGPVAEAAAMTVAATIGTAPLLAFHFDQVSLASLPANLLAAPAVAPIMWLGMLAAAAAQVSPALAEPLNALDGPLLAYLAAVAKAAGGAPGAVLPFRLGSIGALGAAYAVTAAGVAAVRALWHRIDRHTLGPPSRRRAAPVLIALALATVAGLKVTASAAPSFRAAPGELVVSFLDVGQGDATLIQDGHGANVLFDGGPPEARVDRLLAAAGVKHLDLVVATHKSRDHQGGLHAVLERIPTRLLVENGDRTTDPDFLRLLGEADARGIRRVPARAGQVLRIGTLVIRILSPSPLPPGVPPPEEPNPRGVVAIVSSGSFDVWLSADAESEAILPLALRHVEAMKVSHHGSSDPGLPDVLRRLRPEVAAIEVGRGNDYGHPAPTTVAALDAAVPHVYRTDRDGTIRLAVAGDRMRMVTER